MRICLLASVPSTFKAFYRPLIQALRESAFDLTLITSPGAELDTFHRSGLADIRSTPITRSISPVRDLATVCRLVLAFRSIRPDLIHTHTPKAGLLGMVAGWLARVPTRIHTLHGLPAETARGLKRRMLILAERLTCRLAHKVCIVGESLRQRALALGLCDPTKTIILGEGTACGIDITRFDHTEPVARRAREIRREHAIPDEAVVVGFVGWLVADKGITELIDAFTAVAETNPSVHLLMIGADGSNRDPLPGDTLRTIREHSQIHHAGLVADPAPYYAAMDFCVLPTRREGFPIAPLEAAALGVPTVATRVTGCVDAIVDGQTGLLIDPDAPAALQAAIQRMVDEPATRSNLGDAACRRVRTHFSSDRLVAEHLKLYREAMPPDAHPSSA